MFCATKEGILDYPDDFETSAFPAGKWVALSRNVGIWTMTAFLIVIACCVTLPWLCKNRTVNPFIIYVDGTNAVWELVGRTSINKDIPYYESVQRALVGIFTEKWFTISGNLQKNALNWERCNRETVCTHRFPNTFAQTDGCDIYCISGESMYQTFQSKVLPLYQTYESVGTRWYIDSDKIQIMPNGNITENGGTWIVHAPINASIGGKFNVVAYVKVARDMTRYPQTLGYYVASFNSYKE